MTPAKLKRKTKNRLLTYSKALTELLDNATPKDELDLLHDFAMRCYAEGYTHGQAAERESTPHDNPEYSQ